MYIPCLPAIWSWICMFMWPSSPCCPSTFAGGVAWWRRCPQMHRVKCPPPKTQGQRVASHEVSYTRVRYISRPFAFGVAWGVCPCAIRQAVPRGSVPRRFSQERGGGGESTLVSGLLLSCRGGSKAKKESGPQREAMMNLGRCTYPVTHVLSRPWRQRPDWPVLAHETAWRGMASPTLKTWHTSTSINHDPPVLRKAPLPSPLLACRRNAPGHWSGAPEFTGGSCALKADIQ